MRREQYVAPLTRGAVAQRLRQGALAGAGWPGIQNRNFLIKVAAGGEIVDVRAIQSGQQVEVERLECLAHREAGAQQTGAELLVGATSSCRWNSWMTVSVAFSQSDLPTRVNDAERSAFLLTT